MGFEPTSEQLSDKGEGFSEDDGVILCVDGILPSLEVNGGKLVSESVFSSLVDTLLQSSVPSPISEFADGLIVKLEHSSGPLAWFLSPIFQVWETYLVLAVSQLVRIAPLIR